MPTVCSSMVLERIGAKALASSFLIVSFAAEHGLVPRALDKIMRSLGEVSSNSFFDFLSAHVLG